MDLAVYLEKIIQELESMPFKYEWNMTKPSGSDDHNRKMLDLEIENLKKEKED